MPAPRTLAASVVTALALAACTTATPVSRADKPRPVAADEAGEAGEADAGPAAPPTTETDGDEPASVPPEARTTDLPSVGLALPFTAHRVRSAADTGEGLSVGDLVHADGRFTLVGHRTGERGERRPTVLVTSDDGAWRPVNTAALPDGTLRDAAAVAWTDPADDALSGTATLVVGTMDGGDATPALVGLIAPGDTAVAWVQAPELTPTGGLSLTEVVGLPDGSVLALGASTAGDVEQRPVALRSRDGRTWEVDEQLQALATRWERVSWAFAREGHGRTVVVAAHEDEQGRSVPEAYIHTAEGWVAAAAFPGGTARRVADVTVTGDGTLLAVGAITDDATFRPATWRSVDGRAWTVDEPTLVVGEEHTAYNTYGESFERVLTLDDGTLRATAYARASSMAFTSDDGASWRQVPYPDGVIDTEMPGMVAVASDGERVLAGVGGLRPGIVSIGRVSMTIDYPRAFPSGRTATSLGNVTAGVGPTVLATVTETSLPGIGQLASVTSRVVRLDLEGEQVETTGPLESIVLSQLLETPESGLSIIGYTQFQAGRVLSYRIQGRGFGSLATPHDGLAFDGFRTTRWTDVERLDDGRLVMIGGHFRDDEEGRYEPFVAVGEVDDVPGLASLDDPLGDEVLQEVCPLRGGGAIVIGERQSQGRALPVVHRSTDGDSWTRTVSTDTDLGAPNAQLADCETTQDGVVIGGWSRTPIVATAWHTTDGERFTQLQLPELGTDSWVKDVEVHGDTLWMLVRSDDGEGGVTTLVRLGADGGVLLQQHLLGAPFAHALGTTDPDRLEIVDGTLVLSGARERAPVLFTAELPGGTL